MCRRIIDLLFAGSALVLCLPVMIVIYLCLRRSESSPIFRQMRVGKNNTLFCMYKFRTFREGTESVPTHDADQSQITQIGMFLRKTKLDELPQLFNVLNGSMSLVGPRPCLPCQHCLIRERERLGGLDVLPGITGLAQIAGVDMSNESRLLAIEVKGYHDTSILSYLKMMVQTITGLVRLKKF